MTAARVPHITHRHELSVPALALVSLDDSLSGF
jgi:hypothetical protein